MSALTTVHCLPDCLPMQAIGTVFVLQDIVIGRHRDMEDRISWCLAVGRYESALQLAEADRTTTQELWDTVVQVGGGGCSQSKLHA
jgi:hypothetical protein